MIMTHANKSNSLRVYNSCQSSASTHRKKLKFFVVFFTLIVGVLIITINIIAIEMQKNTGLPVSWIIKHPTFHSNSKLQKVLDILSIGTIERDNVHDIYLKGSARYFKQYNEKISNGTCNHQCINKTHGTHATHSSWFWKDQRWWCAQKRPLAAIIDYFDNLKLLKTKLPDFLLVIDDDTFVNTVRIHQFLKWLPNPETNSIYLGDTIGGTFVAGGGGWLVSKKVLKELSKNIHQCLHKQQHATGKWCWYHSDWAIGECIFEFTNTIPVHSNHFIQYSNSCLDDDDNNNEKKKNHLCRLCVESSITCHKYNAEEQLNMHQRSIDTYYNKLQTVDGREYASNQNGIRGYYN